MSVRIVSRLWHLAAFGLLLAGVFTTAQASSAWKESAVEYPLAESTYLEIEAEMAAESGEVPGLSERLRTRAMAHPFNLVATGIFLLAVLHTFLTPYFIKLSHRLEATHLSNVGSDDRHYVGGRQRVSFRATVLHFLGEVELVFGIWLIPLLCALVLIEPNGLEVATFYIDTRNYTEPIFVVVIMAIASSRPIIQIAESCLRAVARFGKQSPAAWWLSILIIAPLLGSFITEPAAMTIAALLLGQQFYKYEPSSAFKYATLGLLFVNISVGGTLTHFAAPPVLMVAERWDWGLIHMFTHFGWRAMLGITIATVIYFFLFRKEFASMGARAREAKETSLVAERVEPVPLWIVTVHLGFIAWTVLTLHHPAFFIGGFLFFLAFTVSTQHHQSEIRLKPPVLVGFFLAGLVVHGGLQSWWISPVLSSLTEVPLFIGSTILTAFNDNASITFLASQVPAFSPEIVTAGEAFSKTGAALAQSKSLGYAVLAGAVTGGGLTVIANAPNPAGQSILNRFFKHGIAPMKLLFGALLPTLVMVFVFMVLPH